MTSETFFFKLNAAFLVKVRASIFSGFIFFSKTKCRYLYDRTEVFPVPAPATIFSALLIGLEI